MIHFFIGLWVLASCAPLNAAQQRVGSVQLTHLNAEQVFDVPGSPRHPHVMERTRLVLRFKNVGDVVIPRQLLLDSGMALEAEDFLALDKPSFVVNGGYWNPRSESGLPPDGTAQVWVTGRFRSEGSKKIQAMTLWGGRTNWVRVLEDPGCLDAHKGDDPYVRGWALGRTACANPTDCMETTRQQDRCSGKELSTFRCRDDGAGAVYMYHVPVACPYGCRDGACARRSFENRHALELLEPKGGIFDRGAPVKVRWRSKGLTQVGFGLTSEKVHKLGGAHTIGGIAVLRDNNSGMVTQKTEEITLPNHIEPSDDWVLILGGADDAESRSGPLDIR